MNTDGSQEIVTQLRIANRLLAAQLRSSMKGNELIALLATTGATHQDIATILGTTPGTVGVALARKRRDAAKSR